MAALSITIGCLDKAAANEIHKLAAPAALKLTTETAKYSREWLKRPDRDDDGRVIPGTGTPDELFGAPVCVLRITAEAEVIGNVLRAYSSHLASEWNRGAQCAADARIWFAK
jgi:hypothetical protein